MNWQATSYQNLGRLPATQAGYGPTKPEKDEETASWLAKVQGEVALPVKVVPVTKATKWIANLSSLMPQAPTSTQFIADGLDVVFPFVARRHTFEQLGKPIVVKVGFHYTKNSNIERIQNMGLKPSNENGFYGSGVYLCENPHAFSTYGDTGILVLYISGTELVLRNDQKSDNFHDVDSFRGNKLSKSCQRASSVFRQAAKTTYFDEIIVRDKSQVLPVFAFPRAAVNNADHLFEFQKKVQELVDRTVNYPEDYVARLDRKPMVPRKTAVRRIYPCYDDLKYEHGLYKQCAKKRGFRKSTRFIFLKNGRVVDKSTRRYCVRKNNC